MSRKRKSERQPFFVLLNVAVIFGSVLLMPALYIFALQNLYFPPVLANMVTGLLTGLLLGFVQQQTGQLFGRRLLAFWVSSSAFGGLVGGLVAGAVHVFLQQLSAFTTPQPIPFVIILAFIGLLQWNVLQYETRRSAWQWPAGMLLLGVSAVQGVVWLPIVFIIAAAFFLGKFLDHWQPYQDEPRNRSLQPYEDRLARLRLPTSAEAHTAPALILAAHENNLQERRHQG